MQFIPKQSLEPIEWNDWFTVPPDRRTFDYGKDFSALTKLKSAKKFLIKEQNSLCAYCQQRITENDASLEHVLPKVHNIAQSTSYFNLVAVCKNTQINDSDNRKHCDATRGSMLLPPIIFYANAESTEQRLNKYFQAYADGGIIANPNLDDATKKQVDAFIEILNLNHTVIKNKRAKDFLNGFVQAQVALNKADRSRFWKAKYNSILKNRSHPFREYLLLFIGKKISLS